MSFLDIALTLIGFSFLVGVSAGLVLVVLQIKKQKTTFWTVLLYSMSLLFFTIGFFELYIRFWEGVLLLILGLPFLPQGHRWLEGKFRIKHTWAIVSVFIILIILIFIPVNSNYNKYYAEIKAKEQGAASRQALIQESEGETLNEIRTNSGYITNGEFVAAITEAYLDEASVDIVDSDKKALDKLIKTKAVVYLKSNIQVDLVQEISSGYDKVEFRVKGDDKTFWTRREAIGEWKGKEISKQQYKELWPFTVDKGTLRCIQIRVSSLTVRPVIFEVNGKNYAINGAAKNWAKRNGYSDSDEIWNPSGSIGLIIEDGLKLCE